MELLADALWGWHVLVLILAAGLWFSIRTGFFQVRRVSLWVKTALGSPKEARGRGRVSPFQALTTALAGSLGTGNIVGVGVALAAGGQGHTHSHDVPRAQGAGQGRGEGLEGAHPAPAPGLFRAAQGGFHPQRDPPYLEKPGADGKPQPRRQNQNQHVPAPQGICQQLQHLPTPLGQKGPGTIHSTGALYL